MSAEPQGKAPTLRRGKLPHDPRQGGGSLATKRPRFGTRFPAAIQLAPGPLTGQKRCAPSLQCPNTHPAILGSNKFRRSCATSNKPAKQMGKSEGAVYARARAILIGVSAPFSRPGEHDLSCRSFQDALPGP